MTVLNTNPLSVDLPGECWNQASAIVPPGNAFSEEFWNASARQMLMGLILHVSANYPAEKRTVETLIKLVDAGIESLAEIRAKSKDGAVHAWLRPLEPEKNEHYTAAILAECSANLHRFMLSNPQEKR